MKKILTVFMFILALVSFAGPAAADRDERHERSKRHGGYAGKFYGVVENMPEQGLNGIWVVNGRKVLVTEMTRIVEEHGRVAKGAYVEVKGNYEDSTFKAYEIEFKGDSSHYKKAGRAKKFYNSKFYGIIDNMPEAGYEGIWIVDGRKVEVNSDTIIDEGAGKAAAGTMVKVKGVRKGNTVRAVTIKVTKRVSPGERK